MSPERAAQNCHVEPVQGKDGSFELSVKNFFRHKTIAGRHGDFRYRNGETMRQNTLKSVISGKAVTVGSTPVFVGGDHCIPAAKVSLVRNGDDIAAIEIRCGCGEVIILDCVYEQTNE